MRPSSSHSDRAGPAPVKLHADDLGPRAAPAVLLLGSLGSTYEMWDAQVPALSAGFRVVRCDSRGHGRSPVPPGPYVLDDLVEDTLALLDRLAVEQVHVVGLSLGGMIGLRLAARAPGRVRTLTVLCTSALLGPADAWAERAQLVRTAGTRAVADTVVGRWLTPAAHTADPARTDRLRAMIASTPAEGYASCCEAIGTMDLRADLGRVTAPTLVVAGADDPATPPEHLERIAAGIAGSQLLVLPQAAHLANVEQPAAVNAALLLHLRADDARQQRGTATRREVLGDAHVDRSLAATTEFTGPFQDFITRTAWGDVWRRPGLDRRTRSMLTLALLTALGQEHELAMHVRAAVGTGVTPEEIGEVLLHSAIYAGVPAANRAFAVAQDVLVDLAAEPDGDRAS